MLSVTLPGGGGLEHLVKIYDGKISFLQSEIVRKRTIIISYRCVKKRGLSVHVHKM